MKTKSEQSLNLLNYALKAEIQNPVFEDEINIAIINYYQNKNNNAFYKMVTLSCMLLIISATIAFYPSFIEKKKEKQNNEYPKSEINQSTL